MSAYVSVMSADTGGVGSPGRRADIRAAGAACGVHSRSGPAQQLGAWPSGFSIEDGRWVQLLFDQVSGAVAGTGTAARGTGTGLWTLAVRRALVIELAQGGGIESKQAEAIVRAIGSSGEATATKAELATATAQLCGEISARSQQDAACPTRHCRVAVCCATCLWVSNPLL